MKSFKRRESFLSIRFVIAYSSFVVLLFNHFSAVVAQGNVVSAMEVFSGRGRFSRTRRLQTSLEIEIIFCVNDKICETRDKKLRLSPTEVLPSWCAEDAAFVFCCFSYYRPQVERVGRFWRVMTHTTKFSGKNCLLGMKSRASFFRDLIPLNSLNFQNSTLVLPWVVTSSGIILSSRKFCQRTINYSQTTQLATE